MNILQDIERKIIKLKGETTVARADLKFRKLMHAIKAGFDPGQPRDEQGDGRRGDATRRHYGWYFSISELLQYRGLPPSI